MRAWAARRVGRGGQAARRSAPRARWRTAPGPPRLLPPCAPTTGLDAAGAARARRRLLPLPHRRSTQATVPAQTPAGGACPRRRLCRKTRRAAAARQEASGLGLAAPAASRVRRLTARWPPRARPRRWALPRAALLEEHPPAPPCWRPPVPRSGRAIKASVAGPPSLGQGRPRMSCMMLPLVSCMMLPLHRCRRSTRSTRLMQRGGPGARRRRPRARKCV